MQEIEDLKILKYTAPLHPNVQIWTMTGPEFGENINHQELPPGFARHLSYLLDPICLRVTTHTK